MGQVPPPNYASYPRPNYSQDPSSRPPGVYFDVLSDAFKMIQGDLGTWIVASLVGIVIYGVAYVAFVAVQFGLGLTAATASESLSPVALLVSLVGSAVMSGLYNVILIGLANMALVQLRGRKAALSDFFVPFGSFLGIFVTGILVSIGTGLGFLACIVPGFFVMGALAFANLLAFDQKLSPIDALQRSFEVLKPHAWMMAILLIVLGLVTGLGALVCGIGLLFTLPVYSIGLAMHYHYFFPPQPANTTAHAPGYSPYDR